MTVCLRDSDLQQILAGREDADAQQHLEDCAGCRARMERLAGLGEISASSRSGVSRNPASQALQSAIASLQAEHPTKPRQVVERAAIALQLPPTDRPGFIGRLGGIEIERLVARGGMGLVFVGFDPALARKVAVKTPAPHLLGDAAATERFLREARSAAALAHENVVTIHAVGEDAGIPFLVLQFVEGESLAERVARTGPLPIQELADIGAAVAEGLAAAHAQGLVHRDVKPANVLIENGTGAVRLTDFGLARMVADASLSSVNVTVGTPAFMSPEQAESAPLDGRSDLFALGATLYAAATGAPPFGDGDPTAVLVRVRVDDPPTVAARRPDCPAWFSEIVQRLLRKNPAERLQSAAEVADLLRRAQAPPRFGKPGRLKTWQTVALATAFLTTVGAWINALPRIQSSVGLTSTTEVATPTIVGYRIAGRDELFSTFSAACAAARDGDTIELSGAGPHKESRTDIRGKRLTLRAVGKERPTVKPLGDVVQWIHTDSELTIEGLDVDWQVPLPTPAFAAAQANSVVASSGPSLVMRSCAVAAGRFAGCAASQGTVAEFDRCRFAAEDGVGVSWQAAPGRSLTIGGCTFDAGSAVFLGLAPRPAGAPDAPCRVSLTDCTIRVGGAWGFVMGFWYVDPPDHKIELTVARNLASANYLVGFPTRNANTMRAALQANEFLKWHGSRNVYRRSMGFVGVVRLRPFTVFNLNAKTLQQWASGPNVDETDSVQADFDIEAPASFREPPSPGVIANPSGPLPAKFGAPRNVNSR